MADPKLKKELLVKANMDKYREQPPGTIDYSEFEANNWADEKEMTVMMRELDKMGGALWMQPDGCLCWRRHKDGEVYIIASAAKMSDALASFMRRKEVLVFKGRKAGEKYIPADVRQHQLKMVEDKFTPFVNAEFYDGEHGLCRTSFRPSEYARIKTEPTDKKLVDMENIYALLGNLVNSNMDYLNWLVNWLAGFFQTLERAGVSLVLKGTQGSGKGIFFDEIITPLFGKDLCVTVDQNRIESQFMPWVDGKLFYNLNEIAVDAKSRKSVKNFLKHLVTEKSVFVEMKFRDAREVGLFGNILICTNELLPIEIEHEDRRFTVFQTGPKLREDLGLDTFRLVKGIGEELKDFAMYLKNYEVDWKLYRTALSTPAKAAIVENTNSRLENLVHAILMRDASFFEDMKNGDSAESDAYRLLVKGFDNNFIAQPTLGVAYRFMLEKPNATTQSISKQLRLADPTVFAKDKLIQRGDYRGWELPLARKR
jgi:hypothetical protein